MYHCDPKTISADFVIFSKWVLYVRPVFGDTVINRRLIDSVFTEMFVTTLLTRVKTVRLSKTVCG